MSDIDEIVDGFQDAWTGRNRSAFANACSIDIHYEDPLCDHPLEGLDAIADHAARLWRAFPDAAMQRTGERLNDGRFIAAPVRVTGTHRGDLPRLPATKKRVSLHAVFFCELDARRERLWRVRAFYDAYDAAVQLGLLPRRGGVGERALLMIRGFGIRG
jgi:steroid delta-isomerase-like uncharacterized protein